MRSLWLGLCVLLCSCATGRVPRIPGDPPPALSDNAAEQKYQDTLERFTAHGGVYDNLDTKAFFYATYQGPTFVAARVQRMATFKNLPPKELAASQAFEDSRLTDATEFFMATHVNDSHFDDFDRSNTVWRLALVVHGEEYKPVSVERIGRTNVDLRGVYSYMESFWVGYRVRFPKVVLQPGEPMVFRAASALGKADLSITAE